MGLTVAFLSLSLVAVSCAGEAPPRDGTGEEGPAPTVSVVLTGQSMPRVDPRLYVETPSATLRPLLEGTDVVFTNLESPVRPAGCVCEPTRNGDVLHDPPPEALDFLQELGVNLLSLANNHSWDLGVEGVLVTLDEVEARGIAHAGTGRNLAEAGAPAFLEKNGVRLALIALATVRTPEESAATPESPGLNFLGLEDAVAWDRILKQISDASTQADAVIVYQHFQTIGKPEWQQRWARAVIDAGAALYVGHGEPVLGGVEVYRSRPIFYDLGNFIFQTRREIGGYPKETFESVVVELTLGRDGASDVRFIPVVVDEGTPGPNFLESRGLPDRAQGEAATAILTRLQELSWEFGTDITVEGGIGHLATIR